jgi:hypothetical protein
MMSNSNARLLVPFGFSFLALLTSTAFAQNVKVDVCHIPPGNPDNAHTITISERAVEVHLDHGDHVGECESDATVGGSQTGDQPDVACACPRPGVWRVTNLDGWMECNALGIKRKLKGAGRNDGAIWILNDDCSTIFAEAYEKDREDVILDRGRECIYFAVSPGEEDGAEVIFDGAYKLESEEFITGEYFMQMSGMGANCSGYRPFDIEFIEPLNEKKYDKLEAKMQKQLDETRTKVEEHSEQIDKYLEETEGGLAFGGRNGED